MAAQPNKQLKECSKPKQKTEFQECCKKLKYSRYVPMIQTLVTDYHKKAMHIYGYGGLLLWYLLDFSLPLNDG